MNAYHAHLLNLVRKMHSIDTAYALEILAPYTHYPHVPPSALVDPTPENRRQALRRAAANQNSYGLPYASSSIQGQNSNYHSSYRNESIGRGVNGDTPNKRRRVQVPLASSNVHHSQLQGSRGDREMDTDDHSTPRRGPSALDAEAYRPGGNTANRVRPHGRKGREGGRVASQIPIVLDANGMSTPIDGNLSSRGGMDIGPSRISGNDLQGSDPGTTGHSATNGAAHKAQLQNGRNRGSSSQHHRTNPNSQPQPYHTHYASYGERNHMPGNPFADPSGYGMPAPSYPPTANLNPHVDMTAYNQHHGVMNMNPNLNHLATSANYPAAIGIGMVIPTSLPPPPGTGHGRPSTGMSGRSAYDVPPSRSAGNPQQSAGLDGGGAGSSLLGSHGNPTPKSNSNRATDSGNSRESVQERDHNIAGTGSSASGGLMPLPMLTSLPPAGVLTHSGNASHAGYVDSALSRGRGFSLNQSYSGNSYTTSDPNQNPTPTSHHAHTTYSSIHPSSITSAHTSQPSHTGNLIDNAPVSEKGVGKLDVHPSLAAPSPTKDSVPSGLHSRGPSVTGPPSSAIHGSLARDPPFWNDVGGAAEKLEREVKPNTPSRGRSGTLDGRSATTANPAIPHRYRDEPTEQRSGPLGDNAGASVEQREGDREVVTLAGHASYQTSTQSTNGPTPSTQVAQLLPPVSGQASRFGSGENVPVTDRFEAGSRDIGISDATGSVNPPGMPDPSAGDRGREQDGHGADADLVIKGEPEIGSRDGQEKAMRTPTRRKIGEEGPFNLDSGSPFKFGEGVTGEITEGQVVDEDSKPYCLCGRPSFGQMIGCDDSECEFEWVSDMVFPRW